MLAPDAPVRRGRDTLTVSGAIPAGLDGSLLQAAAHPAHRAGSGHAGAGSAPLVDYGIRLSGGLARWHRHGAAAQGSQAWRTARVSSGGQGLDEVGATAVARPAADPDSAQWHTVATYPGLGYAEHLRLGPDGAVRHAEPFALDGAPLVPAVCATSRYVVVFDLPVTHRRAAALLGARFPYAWQDGRPARLGLLAHGSDSPRWFPIRPCYVFNPVNAYDNGDRVVVDVIRHERAFDSAAGPTAPPELWRWTLDLRTGTVTERRLAAVPQEWPQVDPSFRGRRHRFVFSAGLTGDAAGSAAGGTADAAPGGLTATALVRHDVVTGATQVRVLEPGCSAGQPVFVPRPHEGTDGDEPAEGDGWLVTAVYDAARGCSDVLILDAGDLCGPPVATVHLPVRLPASLHTRWQPAA
jgi:carotenoid cleavage dioxygenase